MTGDNILAALAKDNNHIDAAERMKHVLVLDRTDSTNRVLKDMARDGASTGQVVIANEQDAGRGRLGRSFFSPKDKGIYFSYLLRPEAAPKDAVSLTAWTAVATVRAIERVSGFTLGIKWVNDLVSGDRKLCGILTEMLIDNSTGSIDSIIAGIGINVNNSPEDFPEDISDIATSLAIEAGHEISRAELAAAMIKEMDKLSANWPYAYEEYLEAYRTYDITSGRDIRIISGASIRPATAIRINDDFSLKVKFSDGSVEDLSSGEVSLKLI
ncbi:MAG: biotin--[Firmicutes bacterium]|nr:biotin--[acetyl-CoA-carboxylase] ligase [Bacillota bacterium]MBR6473608.1 biotin--[acetyl-CoA-carboxylase] ligase [Bacillota bacterium]